MGGGSYLKIAKSYHFPNFPPQKILSLNLQNTEHTDGPTMMQESTDHLFLEHYWYWNSIIYDIIYR